MKLNEMLRRSPTSVHSYSPGYRASEKKQIGMMGDWMDAMSVTPDDIAQAVALVKSTHAFKRAEEKIGKFSSSKLQQRDGTLKFSPNHATHYLIYPNGLIRREGLGTYGARSQTRLKSPKTAMVHGNPVKSLLKTYKNSLIELVNKFHKDEK